MGMAGVMVGLEGPGVVSGIRVGKSYLGSLGLESGLVHPAPIILAMINPEEALWVVSWGGMQASWEADVGLAHVKLAGAAALGRRGRGAALRLPRLEARSPWPRQGKSGKLAELGGLEHTLPAELGLVLIKPDDEARFQ